MISRLGHAMPRFLVGANVAGEGVRERLRSSSIALLGLVTATGLVLVGISYNQGWPDFVDSPIPGIPTARVGEARIAADAVHGQAHLGNASASPRSAPAGKAHLVPDRSSGPHASSQQQPPVTVSDGYAPGPAPSGKGGADVPISPVPAPAPEAAPQAVPQPPAAESPAPNSQPAKDNTPVATSPPASQPVVTVPGNGKAKGHEKSEKSEKGHGKSTAPAPVVPTPPTVPTVPTVPSVPPASSAPSKEAPAPAGEGPGRGHANGHYK
jgi:hypothetical protein